MQKIIKINGHFITLDDQTQAVRLAHYAGLVFAGVCIGFLLALIILECL